MSEVAPTVRDRQRLLDPPGVSVFSGDCGGRFCGLFQRSYTNTFLNIIRIACCNFDQKRKKAACQISPTMAAFFLLHLVRRLIPISLFNKTLPEPNGTAMTDLI
jgi:hypothetical protein